MSLNQCQINIDSTDINGIDGVRLHGQIADTISSSGIREIVIQGLIHGATSSEDLDAKKELLANRCNRMDVRVFVKKKASDTTNYSDIYLGDGKTKRINVLVSQDPTRVATATSWPFIIAVTAIQSPSEPGGGSGGSGGSGSDVRLQGQEGPYRLTTLFSESGTEARALLIGFSEYRDQKAAGNHAITSVVSDGGFAQLIFGTLPAEAATANIVYVIGTGQYDGPHQITSVNQPAGTITIDVVYAGDSTGNADVGTITTPESLLESSKATLYGLIGVGAIGDRDATTGLALSGYSTVKESDVLVVYMSSDWSDVEYRSGVRGWQINFSESIVEDWPDDPLAGDAPKTSVAAARFSVDRKAAPGLTPKQAWATIRGDVIRDAKAAIGEGPVGPTNEVLAYDDKTNIATVTMTFISKNSDVLAFTRSRSESVKLQYISIKDHEGFHIVQSEAGPREKFVSITLTRVAVSEINLIDEIELPKEAGYTYLDITDQIDIGQPTDKKNFGIYTAQKATRTFQRFKFRPGNNKVRIRNPLTQSGR